MAADDIIFGEVPFVKWKFICKTPAEVRSNTRIANQKLKYYLAGFNAGIVSLNRKKNIFIILNKNLKPKKKGSNVFLYEPRVFRKKKGGGVDLPGTKVQRPSQPNP